MGSRKGNWERLEERKEGEELNFKKTLVIDFLKKK